MGSARFYHQLRSDDGKAWAILAECDKIPPDFTTMRDVCGTIALSPMDHEQSDVTYKDEIPSVKHTNLLYTPGKGTYRDITSEWKAGFGGWRWSARFSGRAP